MAQHYNTRIKKKKKEGGGGIAGAIVSIVFACILIAGGYYLYTLFRGEEINTVTISGEWKLPGNPSLMLTIYADGTAHSYEKFTTGSVRNNKDYTYTLEENENGMMVLTLTDVKTGEVETMKITKVSQAQMSVIRKESSFESFTKVNIL